MSVCPVCQLDLDADVAAFSFHVSAHFEESGTASDRSDHGHGDDDELLWADENGELVPAFGASEGSSGASVPGCPVCGLSFSFMGAAAKEAHVADHFDDPPAAGSSRLPAPAPAADPKARAQSHESSVAQKRNARDVTWSMSSIATPPKNVTPGVIPILKGLLEKSATTRSAVLCDASALYITSTPLFDFTWGCGYRNFQMAYSTILSALPPPLADPPAVYDLQTWIERAWDEGYDEVGRAQLGGHLVGRSKWIGTADIWVGLSSKGIRCKLADFPEMKQQKNTHSVLIRWVVDYFKPPVSEASADAFGSLMASQGAMVRISDKPPLILQHEGHSRTIVGVESLLNGETNLLVFDPGKTLPSTVRTQALEAHEPPSSSSSSECEQPPDGSKKRPLKETKQKGSKRKKFKALFAVEGSHLKVFRVNMKTLKRNAAYQILSLSPPADFDEPLMGATERAERRIVVSSRIEK